MSKTYRAELPEYVAKMQGIRRSNASGKHLDRRTRRNRTRGAARAHAISMSRA